MGFQLKTVQFAHKCLKKLGRGGSFPGVLALKMDPMFISKFKMPKHVILVTGTNGKTTTSNLLAQCIQETGLKVINNSKGDNLKYGIATLLATNSNENYEVQADVAVIEVDELTLYRQFKNLKPTMLVVNNFFRDQLDRAGEMENVIRKIMEVTKDFEGDLILNGDDPNVLRLKDNAPKAKVHLFGVGENDVSLPISDEASEGKFCPRCNRRLIYDYYQYSHIGKFRCPYDHYGEEKKDVFVSSIQYDQNTFKVDGVTYPMFMDTIYAVYNCAAVLCAMKSIHLDLNCAKNVFSTFELNTGRNETFMLNHECTMNLIKNPTGANEVMKYIINKPFDKNIAIILNDNDQDGTDVSWIWDTHFERLKDPRVKKIICSGTRCYDMALRLKYEGLEDRIEVIEDIKDVIEKVDALNDQAFIITTYTALFQTRNLLVKQASKHAS